MAFLPQTFNGLRDNVTSPSSLPSKMAVYFSSGALKCFSRMAVSSIRKSQQPLLFSMFVRQKSSSTQPSSADNAKEANWKCRQELAIVFRGLHYYGLSEGVCTHLTMMAPAMNGDGEVMLMIPYGLYWSQVCRHFINLRRTLLDGWRLQNSPAGTTSAWKLFMHLSKHMHGSVLSTYKHNGKSAIICRP